MKIAQLIEALSKHDPEAEAFITGQECLYDVSAVMSRDEYADPSVPPNAVVITRGTLTL
jgi:hypothetical protein